jgi:hyperosmotically inducible periplasmic protein
MNTVNTAWSVLLALAMATGLACSQRTKEPDVRQNIRQALDQAGLNEISVSQDRDRGVVTLTGNVASEDDKSRADSIAKSIAATQVVSDQIGLRPAGDESNAQKVDSELDSGIDKNLEAMLVQHRLDKEVKYDVNNGVVTLKGDVISSGQRSSAERLAKQVPNVKQVVNELEVKHGRATSAQ